MISEQELAEIDELAAQLGSHVVFRLINEIRRLRSALAWYGDEKNWSQCPAHESTWDGDGGQRARDALK